VKEVVEMCPPGLQGWKITRRTKSQQKKHCVDLRKRGGCPLGEGMMSRTTMMAMMMMRHIGQRIELGGRAEDHYRVEAN